MRLFQVLALIATSSFDVVSSASTVDHDRDLASMEEKWSMAEPAFSADGLGITIDFPVTDYITLDMVQATFWDYECEDGTTDMTNLVSMNFVSPLATDPQGNGDSERQISIVADFDADAINSANNDNVYEQIGGESTLRFCVKLELINPFAPANQAVNELVVQCEVGYTLQDGFYTVLNVSPLVITSDTVEEQYGVDAYWCKDGDEATVDEIARMGQQGNQLEVCVVPDEEASQVPGLIMDKILDFTWIRTDAATGGTVTQPSIINSELAEDGLSEMVCTATGCQVVAILRSTFFINEIPEPTAMPSSAPTVSEVSLLTSEYGTWNPACSHCDGTNTGIENLNDGNPNTIWSASGTVRAQQKGYGLTFEFYEPMYISMSRFQIVTSQTLPHKDPEKLEIKIFHEENNRNDWLTMVSNPTGFGGGAPITVERGGTYSYELPNYTLHKVHAIQVLINDGVPPKDAEMAELRLWGLGGNPNTGGVVGESNWDADPMELAPFTQGWYYERTMAMGSVNVNVCPSCMDDPNMDPKNTLWEGVGTDYIGAFNLYSPTWLQWIPSNPAYHGGSWGVYKYTIKSNSQDAAWDPKSWTLWYGSYGEAMDTGTRLHMVENFHFSERNQKVEFYCNNFHLGTSLELGFALVIEDIKDPAAGSYKFAVNEFDVWVYNMSGATRKLNVKTVYANEMEIPTEEKPSSLNDDHQQQEDSSRLSSFSGEQPAIERDLQLDGVTLGAYGTAQLKFGRRRRNLKGGMIDYTVERKRMLQVGGAKEFDLPDIPLSFRPEAFERSSSPTLHGMVTTSLVIGWGIVIALGCLV